MYKPKDRKTQVLFPELFPYTTLFRSLFLEGTLRLKMSELAQENTDATMSKWGPYFGPI